MSEERPERMSHEDRLQAIRRRIDEIDDQLLALISQRAECAQAVAEVKSGAEPEPTFYRPDREARILRRIREQNPGPLSDDTVALLFREIMSACLALEQPLRIAYLGPEGTFTHAAALKHFGQSVTTTALDAIDAVFREVEAGTADYGVVPVENSTEGVVSHTLDMFLRAPVRICGEVLLRVELNLLGGAERLEDVRRILAHPQALAQCRGWLDAHLPRAERLPAASNAEAARQVHGVPDAAALASLAAAERYDLRPLARNVEDEPGNSTRFLVIGREPVPPSGRDKTTLLVSVRNRPGALHGLLEPMARHGISMTRIESRPSRQALWDYVFFVDIEGHEADVEVRRVLQELEERASLLRVLGSYPRAGD